MSSLLEQAIIDASALKDAAIKNAETALLEKYSTDIKEAVESLLEQEEDVPPGIPEMSARLEDSIPLAGQPPEAHTDDQIVLDLDTLASIAEKLTAEEEGDALDHGVADPEMATAPIDSLDPEAASSSIGVALEEEVDLDDLESILEELVVDINPQKSGWAGTPEPIMKHKEELRLAQLSATEAEESNKELAAAAQRLSEEYEKLKTKNGVLVSTLQKIKENFEKVNLANARLLYTNRILTNGSLNERQKDKIVKALSEANSVNEAKVIFETLQNAVGGVSGKAHPQSLRETIEKPSATLPRRAPANNYTDGPATDRMQILAGIKKR